MSTTVPTTFPQGGDFSNNAFNLFHYATFLWESSFFLSDRKEGKYHFWQVQFFTPFSSLSFLFLFTPELFTLLLIILLLDFNHVLRLLKHFGNPWLCSFFDLKWQEINFFITHSQPGPLIVI